MNESDAELIARCLRSDDPSAREELVHRYLGVVRKIVWPVVLDDDKADDVTQEVFVKVFQGLSAFNGDAQFSTWLYRVAMNASRDYLRRENRHWSAATVAFSETPDRLALPDTRAIGAEFGRDIEQALGELSPQLRRAITLVSIGGLSPSEAASIENCTTATMHWRVHQARKRLKQKLKKYLAP